MTFRNGFMVSDALDLRNEADYYLGRIYAWTTGSRTRVIGWNSETVKLAGRPGRVTVEQFKQWVRVGTLREA